MTYGTALQDGWGNIARFMVRQNFRTMLDSGVPEADLIRRFDAARLAYPDDTFSSLARRVLEDYVADQETVQQLRQQLATRRTTRIQAAGV